MNDYKPKRTIEEALDLETGEIILSKEFFKNEESTLIHFRRLQQEAIIGLRKPKYVCPYCYQLLKISGKSTQRGIVSFFAHLYDSDDCEIKTNGEYSKEEIEARKYAGIKESQRHIDLKNEIFQALITDESKSLGIENVALEKRLKSKNPFLNWRQPDVYSEYGDKKLVFELQLSTTFLSIIVARDIFYRLNNTFIIWVFNFSSNQEYVNLDNLMCKDIYYSNKRNAFIFDEKARERTKKEGVLVLLCIWYEPDVQDGTVVTDKPKRHEKYIKITDLMFDEETFKPYYFDADGLFARFYPEELIYRKKKDEESKKWLERLEKTALLKFEKKRLEQELQEKRHKDKLNRIIEGIKIGTHKLSPTQKKGKWGYESDGEILIEPIFNAAEEFKPNKTAKIKKNRKYGFIDITGNEIVPPIFHEVFDIENGFCVGRINREWFRFDISASARYKLDCTDIKLLQDGLKLLIISRKETKKELVRTLPWGDRIYRSKTRIYHGIMDFSGQVLLPVNYSEIESFSGLVSNAKIEGVEGILRLDLDSNKISSFIYDVKEFDETGLAVAKKNGLLGYVDRQHNEVIPCIFDELPKFENEGDKAIVSSDRKFGVVDSNFNILIPFTYNQILPFENQKAKAQKGEFWGYIDDSGDELIPCIYDTINAFEEGKALVQRNALWGYIDEIGNEFLPCIYDDIFTSQEGMTAVKKNDLMGYIDETGIELIPCLYDSIYDFKDGKAKSQKDGLWGYIDERGNEVIPCIYSTIEQFTKGKAKAQKFDLWGYIDELGNEIIPCMFDTIHPFEEAKSKVQKDQFWGYIDENGNEIIPCIYEEIYLFSSGRSKVKKEGLWGYLNAEGEDLIPCKWDWIGTERIINDFWWEDDPEGNKSGEYLRAENDDSTWFNKNFIKVKKDEKWGGVNKNGREILPCIYDEIQSFIDDRAKVSFSGKWGYIDLNGDEVVKPIYDELQIFYDGYTTIKKGQTITKIKGLARYKLNGKRGYVDSNGKEYWQYWQDERDFRKKKRY